MEKPGWCIALASLLLLLPHPPRVAAYLQERKNYIVHLRPRDAAGGGGSVEEWHRSFLPRASTGLDADAGDDGNDGPRIIYSYTDVFTGFAARLTDEEAEAIKATDGCARLYPEVFLPLATTRSPGFLGLHLGNEGFWSRSGFGHGVVIGILDTGILPSHPSFGDDGIQPPPKGWKGTCEFKSIAGGGCNNKIIGARAFGSAAVNSTAPPVDDAGHGTHTASTAAGNFVENANVRGNADGTASGMAPHAHLAIYKVCTRSRCSIMDIIAGLDAAVKDGVDVLSFSIGAYSGTQFNYDPIAIAAFKAMERGIFVSCAAGNAGPDPGTVGNGAPWMLTVAAGTMDRAIRTNVTFFSSRGPSKASPGILKPDITGPGMNILAAWAPSESHTEFSDGGADLSFFVESGTSMSTPHLSGIAALLKSLHPDWSPAAIKDEQYRHATFYAMGAGYANPALAFDPGLVYDLHADDYIPYLCGLGLGDDGVTEIAHRPVACGSVKSITEAELNYPSMVVNLLAQPITVTRTVTNVGKARSVYTAVVDMPKDVSVVVQPPMLRFTELKEKQSFTVTVRWAGEPNVAGAEGNLKWVCDDYIVRSPIVIPAKGE
ncbi:hypothetical protein HU200_035205 [Digitaria exilis]|uniref:Uncharacterized protein n=1 Tax=Digitaria exilis TaxID=1010633 RepID=A0A835BU66_9POAL|nr:hypothetical protein HU200_035205 [Digitaria exilis]